MQKIDKKITDQAKERYITNLIEETQLEFERRRKERLAYERQWELNLNFLLGNQYCEVDHRGELVGEDKTYYWQSRSVFNHIAPIIETRLAKLSRVNPVLSVRPRTDSESDTTNATLAEKLIEEAFLRSDMTAVTKKVCSWSECCGTGFYKVIWNADGGDKIGVSDGQDVYEGEVNVIPVSPFEIYPDSVYNERVEECKSIYQAKAVHVTEAEKMYNQTFVKEELDVFDLRIDKTTQTSKNTTKRKVIDSVLIIERYDLPTKEYPNGRLIIVGGGKLLFDGELPYVNQDHTRRGYPFIKQLSIPVAGCFFGSSVIERLIPVQRAFNAVKNRKHEFLNRLSMGVMMVEDGSIDVDDLATDGLSPGKVLVYRQGATPPEVMKDFTMPSDFSDEENKLINEFVVISGVSDVSSSSDNAGVSSGSALEILIGQDNERMTMVAESIRSCVVEIARKVLRLYAQFLNGVKVIRTQDEFNKTKIYYAGREAFASDDVYLENENELLYSPAQKQEMVLKLYESGLLGDENGEIKPIVKEKVLSLLGYKDLDNRKGLYILHEEKAREENQRIKNTNVEVDSFDEHTIHIDEHTRFVLSEYSTLTPQEKLNIKTHIEGHKLCAQSQTDQIPQPKYGE